MRRCDGDWVPMSRSTRTLNSVNDHLAYMNARHLPRPFTLERKVEQRVIACGRLQRRRRCQRHRSRPWRGFRAQATPPAPRRTPGARVNLRALHWLARRGQARIPACAPRHAPHVAVELVAASQRALVELTARAAHVAVDAVAREHVRAAFERARARRVHVSRGRAHTVPGRGRCSNATLKGCSCECVGLKETLPHHKKGR